MELRRLGTSGLRVSALSLGAMTVGASQGRGTPYGTPTLTKGGTSSDEEARRVFDRALEAGINLVDTANVYTEGRSEELTGEWVTGKRGQLLVATKCRFPIGFGKTRKPGPHEWGLVESLWAADRLQTHRYESIQLQWSLVQRSAERELIPAAAAFGLGVLVWAPLSRGFLSGKYQRGRTAPAGSRLDANQDYFRALDNEKNWNLLDVVGRTAGQHETTHSAVSLAWLLARPQTSSIIVGARTEAQLEDNLRALSVKLTSEDLKELDEASRPDWDYPWNVLRNAEAGDAQLLA